MRGDRMPLKKVKPNKALAEAKSLVDEKNYCQLLEGDQLKREEEAPMQTLLSSPIVYKPTFNA